MGQRPPCGRADGQARASCPSGTTPRTCARRRPRQIHASCSGSPGETTAQPCPWTPLPRARVARWQAMRMCAMPPLPHPPARRARESFANPCHPGVAGLGRDARRDHAERSPVSKSLRAAAGAVQRDRCRPCQAAGELARRVRADAAPAARRAGSLAGGGLPRTRLRRHRGDRLRQGRGLAGAGGGRGTRRAAWHRAASSEPA